MTALLFHVSRRCAHVLMDTACHRADSAQPWNFCTKMVLLPHLQSVVCGRGSRDLIYRFSELVQEHGLATDLAELSDFAGGELPGLAEDCGVTESQSSSIYLFGLSRSTGSIEGRRHSSKDGFRSQVLEGWGVMPAHDPAAFEALRAGTEVPLEDLVGHLVRIKEIDDGLPLAERAVIGGEIQHLALEVASMTIRTCHTFPDHEAQLAAARAARP